MILKLMNTARVNHNQTTFSHGYEIFKINSFILFFFIYFQLWKKHIYYNKMSFLYSLQHSIKLSSIWLRLFMLLIYQKWKHFISLYGFISSLCFVINSKIAKRKVNTKRKIERFDLCTSKSDGFISFDDKQQK